MEPQSVIDSEIVIAKGDVLDFDELQLRVHPAAKRVNFLAEHSPASAVFFDLLCFKNEDLRQQPFELRRQKLISALSGIGAPLHVTPSTTDRTIAQDWFRRFEGAGLDGVMAKPAKGIYEPNKRSMLKVKHDRDCDCVVAGFRWHKDADGSIGSLLLGLHDQDKLLQHVGVCSSFSVQMRKDLVQKLAPYRENAGSEHPWKNWAEQESPIATPSLRMPGGESRWSRGKDASWEPLRPELVAEVAYDHMQGDRFRHITHFKRWRADKEPQNCGYDQLEVVPPLELREIFSKAF